MNRTVEPLRGVHSLAVLDVVLRGGAAVHDDDDVVGDGLGHGRELGLRGGLGI